jgi:EpsI family protein
VGSRRLAIWLCVLMCGVAIAAAAIRHLARSTKSTAAIQLEAVIPKQFGDWHVDERQLVAVVNPQTQQLLDKLYSQTLSRTYVDSRGYRIMLSLAYGSDQRGELQVHRPEVCYPAQGFTLLSNDEAALVTPLGAIAGRRLNTRLGSRIEPVSYWITVEGRAIRSQWDMRWAELRLSLEGKAHSGLLFRVSSIDGNSVIAFREHDRFVNDLLAALAPRERWYVSGVGARS